MLAVGDDFSEFSGSLLSAAPDGWFGGCHDGINIISGLRGAVTIGGGLLDFTSEIMNLAGRKVCILTIKWYMERDTMMRGDCESVATQYLFHKRSRTLVSRDDLK